MFTPDQKQRSNSFKTPSGSFGAKTPLFVAPKSFSETLDGAVNSIALCKEGSYMAAAGRTVFKTFKIENHRFLEQYDLRPGNKTLDSSITDVQWHPNDDALLASSASNGAIVLWDLSKISSNKRDHVFNMHTRTVNKIKFHPFESHLLLSGSHDGTMISFDIRKKTKIATYSGKSDSIRDVQFSPYDRTKFAAACDNGNVQLWDLRRPDGCVNHFPAHSGPVFALEWHPDDPNWLATGGRDKMIKVWDVQHRGPHHCVLTSAPVACIKWRPKERYQIASCSLVFDNFVNIWDIRRPYIPFAVFEEHTSVTTAIIWKDTDTLLSCGKDSMIFQHAMQDSLHPADHAPPVGLGVSAHGDVCHSFCDQGLRSKVTLRSLSTPQPSQTPAFFKRATPLSEEFKAVSSVLKFHSSPGSETNQLVALALQYKFDGLPFEELCDHNSMVASSLGLPDIEKTWSLLKHLYSDATSEGSPASDAPKTTTIVAGQALRDSSGSQSRPESTDSHQFGIMEQPDSSDDNDATQRDSNDKAVTLSLAGPELDMVFGDEQFDSEMFSGDVIDDNGQDWALPSEAFQPRHSFIEESHSLDFNDASMMAFQPEAVTKDMNDEELYKKPNYFPIVEVKLPEFPVWDCTPVVVEMLHRLAELGHIQTTVTALLVLGNRIDESLNSQQQEEWFLSYIELLQRLQLWPVATRVINASTHPSINSINQNSTTVKTTCGMCNKLLTRSGWYCNECKRLVKPCSVCHLPVKGLYAWCPGCSHGGHLQHLRLWFQSEQQCPAGCGHQCEYS